MPSNFWSDVRHCEFCLIECWIYFCMLADVWAFMGCLKSFVKFRSVLVFPAFSSVWSEPEKWPTSGWIFPPLRQNPLSTRPDALWTARSPTLGLVWGPSPTPTSGWFFTRPWGNLLLRVSIYSQLNTLPPETSPLWQQPWLLQPPAPPQTPSCVSSTLASIPRLYLGPPACPGLGNPLQAEIRGRHWACSGIPSFTV